MCNLYSNTAAPEAMRRLFAVEAADDGLGNLEPAPAIHPRAEAPVLRRTAEGRRVLGLMHWGFVLPQTSKRTGKPILPKAVTNARDDRLSDSPFWRESFHERRCLVPATSFAEPRGRGPAIYHWFALAGEEPRPLFAFAGLWRHHRGRYRDAQVEIDTYTIVTTTPNDLVRPVHPARMPVILDPADWETWLGGSADAARALLRPFPADRMRVVREGAGETRDPQPVTG